MIRLEICANGIKSLRNAMDGCAQCVELCEALEVGVRKDVFQKCLVLYPESVWNQRLDLLKQQLGPWKQAHQQMFRQFVSEAEVVTLDGNGRFLISKRLQKAAEIEQDIQFIGMDDTIEIWAPENLKQTLRTDEEFGNEFEKIMNANDAL